MKAEFVMNRSFEGKEFIQAESSKLESALSNGEKNLNHQYYLPEIMSQRISSAINHTACTAYPEYFFFLFLFGQMLLGLDT